MEPRLIGMKVILGMMSNALMRPITLCDNVIQTFSCLHLLYLRF